MNEIVQLNFMDGNCSVPDFDFADGHYLSISEGGFFYARRRLDKEVESNQP